MGLSSETLVHRVRAAIAGAGLMQKDVASAADIDPTKLSRALNGLRNFRPLELARIADVLNIRVQDLLADEDAACPPVLAAARTQPESKPAVTQANERVDVLLELDRLLVDLGVPNDLRLKSHEVAARAPYIQGEELARAARADAGLNDDELPRDMRELQQLVEERYGVDVAIESLPRGLDGLSVACGQFRLILVSSSIAPTRQRFTLAHELGHLAAGDTQNVLVDEDVYKTPDDAERRANAFAAAFLIPAAPLRASFAESPLEEELIARLLGQYQVSLEALAFRAHNVGAVDAVGRDQIRQMVSTRLTLRGGRKENLESLHGMQCPGLLLDRALGAYVDGKISVRPIAGLLNTDPDIVLAELAPIPPDEICVGEDVLVP